MQHKVPQYIEVEDKIFGPFTAKQFSYISLGIGLSIILWRIFEDSSFLIPILAPVIGFSLALAFLKPNGKPFIYLVQNFLTYLIRPKKLFWRSPGQTQSRQNINVMKKVQTDEAGKQKTFTGKVFSSNQIKNLAKNLDK